MLIQCFAAFVLRFEDDILLMARKGRFYLPGGVADNECAIGKYLQYFVGIRGECRLTRVSRIRGEGRLYSIYEVQCDRTKMVNRRSMYWMRLNSSNPDLVPVKRALDMIYKNTGHPI